MAEGRIDILGLCSRELEAQARRRVGKGAGVAGALYARAFRTGRLEPEAFGLSATACRAWRDGFEFDLLEPLAVVDESGPVGLTSKALMRTRDGREIECVRIPMRGEGRSTLCLSSQAGCRMGCAFCETGRGGLARNLTAAEIVSQVVTARAALGWDCRNIVFMGMGEPLDNFAELARALAVLMDDRGLGYSQERITVCTAGHVEGIRALRELGYRRLGLSVSLGSGEQGARARLMPIAARWGLDELAAALAAYPRRRNFALGVNYCLLPGMNDAREDAAAVARFCARVGRCLVNLIPYNPGRSPIASAPSLAEQERFLGWLREEGLEARSREAKGASIMAACGQLGGIADCQSPKSSSS